MSEKALAPFCPLLPGHHQKGSGVCAPLFDSSSGVGMHPPYGGEMAISAWWMWLGRTGPPLTCMFPCGQPRADSAGLGWKPPLWLLGCPLPPRWEVAPQQLVVCFPWILRVPDSGPGMDMFTSDEESQLCRLGQDAIMDLGFSPVLSTRSCPGGGQLELELTGVKSPFYGLLEVWSKRGLAASVEPSRAQGEAGSGTQRQT